MKRSNRIPYGYYIKDSTPVINEEEAAIIRALYKSYTEGATIDQAVASTHASLGHSRATHILRNDVYVGDGFYPAIIDQSTYARAQEIAKSRNHRTSHSYKSTEKIQEVCTSFTWSDDPQKILKDSSLTPAERAEAIYPMIKPKEK